MREISTGAFSHLATAAQAASRALLLANLGSLGDVRIQAEEHVLVLRRAGGSAGQLILVAVVPAGSDLDSVAAALTLPRPDGPRS
jgi:hypothetical protein